MKKITTIFALIILVNYSFGQKKLIKDIDFDGKEDTVFIDSVKSTIVCKLSTLNYKSISCKPIEILNETCGIRNSKNGFKFYNDWMRAGYENQFRYNPKTKKIQLIGMSRYEFGNAAHDGAGESSVNLLTDDYIGNWNYYDEDKSDLIKIPTIKTKMKFKSIHLEDFSDETYFNYADRCSDLFYKYKKIKMMKK
ncbi:hypothetical protein ACFFLS_04880 [Flavobacterium procerum]|uniref:Uncharacterized protein n=1 Tax=Flavobacterium procerum TaxID=1455569 RepID=A0ABV6BP28_9FLAO